MTDAERRIWSILRSRRVEGFKFRRQHPYEHVILDFVCLELGLAIEIDGGQHADSAADREQDTFMRKAGFTVLRFWNHDVLQHLDAVADSIWHTAMALKRTHPLPNPPPEGEGAKP